MPNEYEGTRRVTVVPLLGYEQWKYKTVCTCGITRIVYTLGRDAGCGPGGDACRSVVGIGVRDAAECQATKCLGGFAGSGLPLHSNRSNLKLIPSPIAISHARPPGSPRDLKSMHFRPHVRPWGNHHRFTLSTSERLCRLCSQRRLRLFFPPRGTVDYSGYPIPLADSSILAFHSIMGRRVNTSVPLFSYRFYGNRDVGCRRTSLSRRRLDSSAMPSRAPKTHSAIIISSPSRIFLAV